MAIAESLKKLQMKLVHRKDAFVGGAKYTLQVLSLKEEQRIQAIPMEGVDTITFFNDMRKSILAHAIRAVDGEEIPDIIEVEGPDGSKTTRERAVHMREFLEDLPEAVVDNLFQIYGDMREEKEQEISKSVTYSWYKTPEQRDKERKLKETEEVRETAKETASKEPKQSSDTAKSSDVNGVPSPDADIVLRKLPDNDVD